VKKTLSLLLALALVLSFSVVATTPVAAQTTYYVCATDGDDAHPGTEGEPFATIQHAIGQAADGDTIVVAAGTYDENLTVETSGLTIQSADGRDATTVSADDDGSYAVFIRADDVTFDGFTVTNGKSGIVVEDASGCKILNCIVEENTVAHAGYGVMIQGLNDKADNNLVENVIARNNWNKGFAIEYDANNNIIRGCEAYNNFGGFGISREADGNTIENCVAYDHPNEYHVGEGSGFSLFSGPWRDGGGNDPHGPTNNRIIGCEAYDNLDGLNIKTMDDEWSDDSGQDITGNVIKNNTFRDNEQGIRIVDESDVGQIKDNLANYNNIYDNTVYGVKNVGADPFDARYNWWGTTDAGAIEGMIDGPVDYEPALPSEWSPVEVGLTANAPVATIGISVSPTDIHFGDIFPGDELDGTTITVENTGNVRIDVDAEILDDTPYATGGEDEYFYTEALKLNDAFSDRHGTPTAFGVWAATALGLVDIAVDAEEEVTTALKCPDPMEMGKSYTGTLIFWAVAANG